MKNLKKMILGFATVALVVSASAFKPSAESKRLTHRYGNNGTKYVKVDPAADTEDCIGSSAQRCLRESDTDYTTGFEYNAIPGDAPVVSGAGLSTYGGL